MPRAIRALPALLLLMLLPVLPGFAQVSPELQAELGRLFSLSQQAQSRKDYATARQALETGIRYAQGAGDRYSVGVFTGALAGVYSAAGDKERAVALGNQAAGIQAALGDKKTLVTTLNNLGVDYAALRQWDRAAEAYQRAIPLYQELGRPEEAVRLGVSTAAIYVEAGQDKKAEALLQNLIRVVESHPNPKLLLITLNSMGAIAMNRGQMDQARSYFQRTLDLSQRIGDKKLISGALNNLGLIFFRLGQKKAALDHYDRALALLEPSDLESQSALLVNLGNLAIDFGQLDQAVRYLTRSVQVEQAKGDRRQLANSLDALGQAYSRMNQWDRAIESQTRALNTIQPLGNIRDTARVLGNLGATCKGKGDYPRAAEYLSQALALKRRFAPRAELATTLSNLALIHFDQNKLDAAAAAFVEAIEHNEAQSREVREASKVGEFQDPFRAGLYRRYAHLLLLKNRPEEALTVLERGRNQGLARQAAQNRADFSRALPPNDAQRLQGALAAFNAAAEEMRKIEGFEGLADAALPSAEKAHILNTRARYDEAERALTLTRAQLGARYPAYRRLAGTAPTPYADLKALAERNPDTLYLQWAIGDEKTSLQFALSQKQGLKSFTLPGGFAEVRKLVGAWRAAITETDEPKAEAAAAGALYAFLFSELEKSGLLDAGFSRLTLVGDGPLLEVPFAALLSPDGKRLVERFPLSTAVSLSVLTWPDDREKPQAGLLCVADPTAPGAEPLPAARREGQVVSAMFPGASLLVGPSARRGQVLRDLGRYSLLHFASHGYLDDEDGLKSGLVLAPDPGSEEGLLEARELINTRLAAHLAVLSACETGQGQKSGGEGLLGLTWAFRAAGCPSVVASLWSVDDDATGRLMVRFYQELKAGKRKDEALREAMLAIKAGKADPFFWAAFQVNGDAGAIKF